MAKERTNPFYVALLIAGIAFAITACAYAMMILQERSLSGSPHPLIKLMRDRGLTILLVELAFLALFTFAAIGTDDWWSEKKEPEQLSSKNPPDETAEKRGEDGLG